MPEPFLLSYSIKGPVKVSLSYAGFLTNKLTTVHSIISQKQYKTHTQLQWNFKREYRRESFIATLNSGVFLEFF